MKINLQNAGKRFNREWIFRHFNYCFFPGNQYAITGPNGSGKSTLLQVIAGAMLQSEGEVLYEDQSLSAQKDQEPPASGNQKITSPHKYLSFAAPYLELIEEMTAAEFLSFHAKFKPLTAGIAAILEETGLATAAAKQIRYFSSGMKQRLKLAQAFFSDTPALLLDEPTTNLDAEGIALYASLIHRYGTNRLVIISSNDAQEYGFCKEVIRIGDYK
jgi:ABC-type multidrug transport system ATPase subunit